MNKKIYLLTILLLLTITGCGGGGNTTETTNTNNTTETTNTNNTNNTIELSSDNEENFSSPTNDTTNLSNEDCFLNNPKECYPNDEELIITEPPVTEPPATEPPATEPPATEPPATEPPATEPPATEPPVTEPPVTEPPVTPPEDNYTCISGKASVLGKVIDINTKKPISNALVVINGCYTYTNGDGFFQLLNVKESSNEIIYTHAKGYLKNYKNLKIDRYLDGTSIGSNNFLTLNLDKYQKDISVSENDINENNIIITDKTFYKNNNQYVNNDVSLKFYYSNMENRSPRNFPSSFYGFNSNGVKIMFENKSLISFDFYNSKDEELIFNGEVELIFNITSTENILPLWKFNSKTETWEEMGSVEKDGSGKYTAIVSSSGIWAINTTFKEEKGTFIGRIIYADNTDESSEDNPPAKDLRVHLFGKNWMFSSLSTDDNGEFTIPVKANSDYSIYAYDYKADYKAEYSGKALQRVASGEIFDERS